MTRVRAVTAVLTGLAALAVVLGVVAAAKLPAGSWLASFLVAVLIGVINTALAVLVAWKAPDNWCAAVLALAGCWMCASATSDLWQAGFPIGSSPPNPWVIALTQGAWMLYYLPLAWLILIFPTGRLLSPRWRTVLVGLPLVVVIFNLTAAMAPGPYTEPFTDSPKVLGTSEVAGFVSIACLPIFLALLVASVVSMVQRYRRAGIEEKVQLRWMAVAGLTVPLTLLLCWVSYLLLGTADLVGFGLVAMYLAIPAATAIAIVRSTLFDVDQLLIRGAVYAGFAVLLVAALGLVSGLAGWWLGRDSVVLAVAVTVLVLLGCLPLRRRAERRVAAWLFPDREQVLRSLERLRTDVHAGVRPPEALEETLQDALRDPALRVGYLLPGRSGYLDQHGNPLVPHRPGLEVQMAGDRIATVVSSRPVLGWSTEIATTVGFLSELVRLRLETAQALHEAEASRRRLVAAHDEERHRLERDLHDGAQQRLVALGMTLRRVQRRLPERDGALAEVFDASVAELQAAVSELRQIAHGLRPSSLDDGLSAALDSLRTRLGVPLQIEVATQNLPEPISTTAYFVASEAVTNAIKYASARTIALTVNPAPGGVVVQVRDDGRGGAVVRHGSGLAGLQDRVRAVGGELSVVSQIDRGTLVEAVLPCAS
ncbi:MAG TPA: histidine kinase [Propionibacteriaceae bacterium]|nr:histidine kinase [Propionibacteriaceae bacterium]